jgi:phage terminase large subunit-like protein
LAQPIPDPERAARMLLWTQKNRVRLYRPYPKQEEFHRLGIEKRERCLLAANQSGKTHTAGAEGSFHATGNYPDWWNGRRFGGPVRAWVGCTSAEMTRDNPQRILLGPPGAWGTGTIPESSILEVKRSRTTSEGVDILLVKHRLGGASQITFKSYEQRREKWQGESLHFVWFDEEPPKEIYTEGLTRTNATRGFAMMTATPLLGMTQVVMWFYPHATTEDRALVQMTLEDCRYPNAEGHYSDEQIKQIVDSYPEHEREARARGVPMLGSGRVFPVAESMVAREPFQVPEHWKRIGGLDFGWDHPTAAVDCRWDVEADVFYVVNCYRQSQRTPGQHAMTLRKWGTFPWAWPTDGLQTDKTSGVALASQYRDEGLRMLREKATFEEGGYGVEAGVTEMLDRMQTGRLKVFNHLEEWFSEFRTYHRKDGKVVKENDDLLAATRYALMMRRYARVENESFTIPKSLGRTYDPLSRSARRPEAY